MTTGPSPNLVDTPAGPQRAQLGGSHRITSASLSKIEWSAALLLTFTCIVWQAVHLVASGALWRDEAGALGVANLSSLKDIFTQFPHEAFPMLFPVTVRLVTHLGGNSDLGYRIFGFLVGLGILAAVWASVRQMRGGLPLLSLALLGFNSELLQWGSSLRGYGMGTGFIVLTVGLLWRLIQRPNRLNFLAAALAATAAVQCLLHNAPLLLALCLAGTAIALQRRSWTQVLLVLSVGFFAALTLLPYLGPLGAARHWDLVVRTTSPPGGLWTTLGETLGPSGGVNAVIWTMLILGALALCLFRPRTISSEAASRELLLFCLIGIALSLISCLGFLELLSYIPRTWYFLALIAVLAVLIDGAFNQWQVPLARVGRLFVVAAVVLTSLSPTWRAAQTRQTNVDLIAGRLNAVATSGDLIVVRPWAVGISLERYYTNSVPWMTVPPISFHQFHRYDLVQDKMRQSDAEVLQPLCSRIAQTLKAGRTVWFVGELAWSAEPSEVNTPASAKSQQWARELGNFLRHSASHLQAVPVPCSPLVNHFENVPLWKLQGWSGDN